jgi:hypothetical protein
VTISASDRSDSIDAEEFVDSAEAGVGGRPRPEELEGREGEGRGIVGGRLSRGDCTGEATEVTGSWIDIGMAGSFPTETDWVGSVDPLDTGTSAADVGGDAEIAGPEAVAGSSSAFDED